MKKYFALYRIPVETMNEWKKNTSPEVMQEQGKKLGEDMGAWMEKHKGSFVEKGLPLGKTKRVTKDGIVDAQNDLNYYCIIEAESHEEAAKMFSDNPHFIIPTAYVDVMEIPHMGM